MDWSYHKKNCVMPKLLFRCHMKNCRVESFHCNGIGIVDCNRNDHPY